MDLTRGRHRMVDVRCRIVPLLASTLAVIAVGSCGGSGGMDSAQAPATQESQATIQPCEYPKSTPGPVPPGQTTASGGATCSEALRLYRHGDRGTPWTCRSKQPGGQNSPVQLSCANGSQLVRFGGLTP